MGDHFNGLTPAQAERLAWLIEECGEVIQAASKVLRHGYESYNPLDTTHLSNRVDLEKEMGHVRAAMIMLCDEGDTSRRAVHDFANSKRLSVKQWMHHQEPSDGS